MTDHLRERMDEIVRDYNDTDPDSVQRIREPIDGTAFFPGGHGLWRSAHPHGQMPQQFPEKSIMLVGHNFDSVQRYGWSVKRGIEVMKWPTWRNTRAYISYADLTEEQCFFTNALMGLQPKASRGMLRATDLFRAECLTFLGEQIAIIRPKAVIALGKESSQQIAALSPAVPVLNLLHPLAALRHASLAQSEGRRLGQFLANLN